MKEKTVVKMDSVSTHSESILQASVLLVMKNYGLAVCSLESAGFINAEEQGPESESDYRFVKRIGATQVELLLAVDRSVYGFFGENNVRNYFIDQCRCDNIYSFDQEETNISQVYNTLLALSTKPFIAVIEEGVMLNEGWLDSCIFYSHNIENSGAVTPVDRLDNLHSFQGLIDKNQDDFHNVWISDTHTISDDNTLVVSRDALRLVGMLDEHPEYGGWRQWQYRATLLHKLHNFAIPTHTKWHLNSVIKSNNRQKKIIPSISEIEAYTRENAKKYL